MGYDSVDINALKKHNILLGNTALATSEIVAELTVGLLIATTWNLLDANKRMKL